MYLKKAFTMIELMIVVAVIAILALIAVSQYMAYIERSRSSACQYLLQNLVLAQFARKTLPGADDDFLPVIDPTVDTLNNLKLLSQSGFRPDTQVGFAAVRSALEPEGGFILFAAYRAAGSKILIYNFTPRNGVRPYDPAAYYTALLPADLYIYNWEGDVAGAVAFGHVSVSKTSGSVESVTIY